MFEIILLTVIVILGFAGVSWYSYKRSQQRAAEFEKELDLGSDHGSEEFQQRFDDLFEQQLNQQSQTEDSDSPQADLFAEPSDKKTDESRVEQTQIDTLDTEHEDETPEIEVEPESGSLVSDDVADWDMVIALTIMAPEDSAFTGRAVLNTLDRHGLHFGEMQIYHRFVSDNRQQPLFSIANIMDPGVLLPNKLFSSTTPGLLIFARLPGPVSGMALFDEMLDVALGMTSQLGGVLCDEKREPINQTGLEEIRSRILSYQMSLQNENPQTNDYLD